MKFECRAFKDGKPQNEEGKKIFDDWEKAKKGQVGRINGSVIPYDVTVDSGAFPGILPPCDEISPSLGEEFTTSRNVVSNEDDVSSRVGVYLVVVTWV